jgi:hypothetical protein
VFRTALGRGQAAVMVGATTAALTVMEQVLVAVWAGALESTACSVKLDVPAAVAVPERTPLALRVRPAGSDPADRENVTDPVAPMAARVCENAVPTVGGFSGQAVAMPKGGGGARTSMVTESTVVSPTLLVALSVMTCLPAGRARATI